MTRADLRAHGPAGVLRPGIRTYKPRRTRITERAERALREQRRFILPLEARPLDLEREWDGLPVVMEIGFGDGLATAHMAAANPSLGILAVDVHTPGVGELLARIGEARLTNIRVIEADALGVLSRMIGEGSLAGLRTYFPDPWPKARHHKRRLVQPDVLRLAHTRIRPGGSWHAATDWDEYALVMASCFEETGGWEGGVVPRPSERPVTRYERRALRDGRAVTDLIYRVTTPV